MTNWKPDPTLLSIGEYNDLMENHPDKFTPAESGYEETPRWKETCIDCRHYFKNPLTRATMCEIVRPPGNRNVPPVAYCAFFTEDGLVFPLYEKVKKEMSE